MNKSLSLVEQRATESTNHSCHACGHSFRVILGESFWRQIFTRRDFCADCGKLENAALAKP